MNHKRFKANKVGRDFIIGDLHGCYDELMEALNYVKFDPEKDRLFSVGDLIDRGPKSLECLKLIDNPWFHTVMGNHEEMMFMSLMVGGSNWINTWKGNGGKWAYEYHNLVAMGSGKEFAKKYLKNLPLVISVGTGVERFNIVHADMYDGDDPIGDEKIDNWKFKSSESVMRDRMLWGRGIIHKQYKKGFHQNLSTTYVGHTPIRNAIIIESQVFIDTGLVYPVLGRGTNTDCHLTMVEHGEQRIIKYYPFDKRFVTSHLTDLEKD